MNALDRLQFREWFREVAAISTAVVLVTFLFGIFF